MRIVPFGLFSSLVVAMAFARNPCLLAQDAPAVGASNEASGLIVGHPFSAIKYARRVKVLPDGKLRFLRNERYPDRIARDADGRLMMRTTELAECYQQDLPVPPVCPVWSVFVIDPVAHLITHWPEGERSGHVAVDFPLSEARLEEAVKLTTTLPGVGPDFTDEDGKVSEVDQGDGEIEGVAVHGMRWTLRYDANQDGQTVRRTRIHEVWTSADMQLIIRVIDGDPKGEESIWGLEKISLSPDAALFQPPDGFEIQHRTPEQLRRWGTKEGELDDFSKYDFEDLKTWFEKLAVPAG
jgi:hypothetical protein